jgi:hypothetical protein
LSNFFALGRISAALRALLPAAAILALAACLPPRSAGISSLKDGGAPTGASSFRFGVAPHDPFDPASGAPHNVDIVGVGGWILKDGGSEFHADFVRKIIAANKTPLLYIYIAADTAKSALGAGGDCDGNADAPLCTQGAGVIRDKIDEIVSKYEATARLIGGAANGKEVLLHIEPDWYQYSQAKQQRAFSAEDSDGFRNRILGAIKNGCPSCQVIIDFSPWFRPDGNPWQSVQQFFANADRSVVKYLGLVGKPFPFTTDKIDGNLSYAEMTQQTGLPLMVSSAFTFKGVATGLDDTWLANDKIEQAKSFGIAGVMMALDQADRYDTFIASYKSGASQEGVKQPDPPPTTPQSPQTPPPATPPQPSQTPQPATPPSPPPPYPVPGGTEYDKGPADCTIHNDDGKTCQDVGVSPGQQSCKWDQTWECIDGCAKWVKSGCP